MLTKRKDLRTGRAVWEQGRAPSVPHQPLKRDLETDVLVIGAGITGAMVADALRDSGLRIAVVDRRGPAKGSSTASTALVQYEIDMPLTKLARKIGQRDAQRTWRRSRLAVDAIKARLNELEVPDVTERDSLYLAGNMLDRDGLMREHEARKLAGLASTFLNRSELRARFGIARSAALLGYGNLAIDPRKTTIALFNAAAAQNTTIFLSGRHRGHRSQTERRHRHRIERAAHSLPASGVRHRLRIAQARAAQGHHIASTWAIATVPQKRRLWPGQCMIWEFVRSISLFAHNAGRSHHLRRRGRGVLRTRPRATLLRPQDRNAAAQVGQADPRRGHNC